MHSYFVLAFLKVMDKAKEDTASIVENNHCINCGWPVIHVCCNYPFTGFKDADDWDWWFYCSNKCCKNHDGEGVHYNWPEWSVAD